MVFEVELQALMGADVTWKNAYMKHWLEKNA